TSIEGFHNPKATRYARGRYSAEGYYFDGTNLAAIRTLLLDPLGSNGDRRYCTEAFDLEKDVPTDKPPLVASEKSVLIVDGTFLQRPELVWDLTIFVDASDLYEKLCNPRLSADVVIDNNNFEHPRMEIRSDGRLAHHAFASIT